MQERTDINWIWQVGKLYYDEFSQKPVFEAPNVRMMAFIDDMPGVYAASDIAVCRAGALTIAELELVGMPAILIPSPNVAEDHQTKNALALVNENAALMVKDVDAKTVLMDKIIHLLEDGSQRQLLRDNILKQGKEDAAMKIAEEIIELVKE